MRTLFYRVIFVLFPTILMLLYEGTTFTELSLFYFLPFWCCYMRALILQSYPCFFTSAISKVFGMIALNNKTSINRHNNFRTFPDALMLLFRYTIHVSQSVDWESNRCCCYVWRNIFVVRFCVYLSSISPSSILAGVVVVCRLSTSNILRNFIVEYLQYFLELVL